MAREPGVVPPQFRATLIKKGEHPVGRAKGTPNTVTQDLREMVNKALTKAGGVDYLWEQSKENPVAFLALVGKCLPKDIRITGELSINQILDEVILRRDAARKAAVESVGPAQSVDVVLPQQVIEAAPNANSVQAKGEVKG